METRLCAVRINSRTLKCDHWSRQSLQASSARIRSGGEFAGKGTGRLRAQGGPGAMG